ncbi:MAG: hydrogenase iron-sulfur subunit [Syntrophobacteraceae bacterium]
MNLSDTRPAFEPKILAFACNWCSYAAADLAGTARVQYPANLRIIRVMCSGMVHPHLVTEAFECGADGVLLMGCHPGECHYQDGNQKAKARSPVIEEVLSTMGLELERFRLVWCSSAEAERFAAIARETDESLRAIGPSRYRKDASIYSKSELIQCP